MARAAMAKKLDQDRMPRVTKKMAPGALLFQRKYLLPVSFIFTSLLFIHNNQRKRLFLKDPPKCRKDAKVIILVTSNVPNFDLREAQR